MNYLPAETPPKYCKYCKASMLRKEPETVVMGYDPLTGAERYYTSATMMYCSQNDDYHPKWVLTDGKWTTP